MVDRGNGGIGLAAKRNGSCNTGQIMFIENGSPLGTNKSTPLLRHNRGGVQEDALTEGRKGMLVTYVITGDA